ncbi:hypothetical protein ACO0SA_000044 [Hanseniaspora valbyensis]
MSAPTIFKHLKNDASRTVKIVLAPFNGGQPHGGVDLGPDYMMKHGLRYQIEEKLKWKTEVLEPLAGLDLENLKKEADLKEKITKPTIKRADLVALANKKIFESCRDGINKGEFQLTIGGDHSIAIGSVAGLLSRHPNAGLIWIDAHADINTVNTTETGNLHGCPISFLANMDRKDWPESFKWIPENLLATDKIAYIGLRDVDEAEKKILRDNNIKAFSMYHIDRFGINSVVEQAIAHISKGDKDCPIMVSYDVDAIDPEASVKCTGTKVDFGLNNREALFLCERICETGNVVALDVVEVNPTLGADEKEILKTVAIGCSIVRCSLGETLL